MDTNISARDHAPASYGRSKLTVFANFNLKIASDASGAVVGEGGRCDSAKQTSILVLSTDMKTVRSE